MYHEVASDSFNWFRSHIKYSAKQIKIYVTVELEMLFLQQKFVIKPQHYWKYQLLTNKETPCCREQTI